MILNTLLVAVCLLSSVIFSVKAREAWVQWKTKGHLLKDRDQLVGYSFLAILFGVGILVVLLANSGFLVLSRLAF